LLFEQKGFTFYMAVSYAIGQGLFNEITMSLIVASDHNAACLLLSNTVSG
jgi:hypothetical protein